MLPRARAARTGAARRQAHGQGLDNAAGLLWAWPGADPGPRARRDALIEIGRKPGLTTLPQGVNMSVIR